MNSTPRARSTCWRRTRIGVVILIATFCGPVHGAFGQHLAFVGDLARGDDIVGRHLALLELKLAAIRQLPGQQPDEENADTAGKRQ